MPGRTVSRPHPLARAALVDRLDHGLHTAWDRGWMPPVPLDADALTERALKRFSRQHFAAGRAPDDAADFDLRLEKICAAVQTEARLNSVGRAFAYGLLMRALKQRLALGALWQKRPELAETEIAPPIIIVGQMRSGTTRIHRLLAADPAHSATRFCDSWNPVPKRPDIRPVNGGLMLFAARKLDPWIDALHPFGAARADEELGWLASALNHCPYEAQWHIPSYVAFSERRDPAPIYREFARILQTDAAHHGNAMRPRVLKVPQFSEDLAALLDQFPAAKVIVSRRSDDETLRSSVSLVANQMTIQSDHANLAEIESEWARKLALRSERMEAALRNFHGHVAEADFEALGDDWESEIKRIYAALEIGLSHAALSAMGKEMRSSEASPHHRHKGDLDRFSGD